MVAIAERWRRTRSEADCMQRSRLRIALDQARAGHPALALRTLKTTSSPGPTLTAVESGARRIPWINALSYRSETS